MSSTAQEDPLIGVTFGRCRLERMLGAGGMGQVYLARHTALDLPVAVKILPPSLGQQAQWHARFVQEAKLAARIEHPHIVRVLDAGQERGTNFLVMEFIEGHSLADRLNLGPLPVEEAIRVTRDAAKGLALAHGAGLIHRDIKPDNLMVTTDGVLKVTDFGLARGAEGTTISVTGQVLGTPAYMSPEQATGVGVDQRTDIYSLGVTLFALIEGRSPFARQNLLASLRATSEEPLPRLSREGVPEALFGVLRKMTAKLPDMRYQQMSDVVGSLERLLAPAAPRKTSTSRKISAVRASSSSRLASVRQPGADRPIWPLIAGGAALLLLMLLGAWWGMSGGPTPEARKQEPVARKPEEKKPEPTPAKQKAPEKKPVVAPKKRQPIGPSAEALLSRQGKAIGELLEQGKLAEVRKLLDGIKRPEPVDAKRFARALAGWQRQLFDRLAGPIGLALAEHPPPADSFARLSEAIDRLPIWRNPKLVAAQEGLREKLAEARERHQKLLVARAREANREEFVRQLKALRGQALGTDRPDAFLTAFRTLMAAPLYQPFHSETDQLQFELSALADVSASWQKGVQSLIDQKRRITVERAHGGPLKRVLPLKLIDFQGKRALQGEYGGGKIPMHPSLAQRARWSYGELPRARRDLVLGVVLCLAGKQETPEAQEALERASKVGRFPLLPSYRVKLAVEKKEDKGTKKKPDRVKTPARKKRRPWDPRRDKQLQELLRRRQGEPAPEQLRLTMEALSRRNGFKVVCKEKKFDDRNKKILELSLDAYDNGENKYLVDIAPLYGLPLTKLNLSSTMVSDLRPLIGMKLTDLSISGNHVLSDLSPLKGQPLRFLDLTWCTALERLEPLRGMKLSLLTIDFTRVRDLSPLAGMPLKEIRFNCIPVTDLRVLGTWKKIDKNECPQVPYVLGKLSKEEMIAIIDGFPKDQHWRKNAPEAYEALWLLARRQGNAAIAWYRKWARQKYAEEGHKFLAFYGWGIVRDLTDPRLESFFTERAKLSLKKQYALTLRVLQEVNREDMTSANVQFEAKARRVVIRDVDNLSDLRPLRGLRVDELIMEGLAIMELDTVLTLKGLNELKVDRCPQIDDLEPLRALRGKATLELARLPLVEDLRALRDFPDRQLSLGPRLIKLPRK